MKATVSILIPLYNSAKYIAETLDSLLSQTYKDIEIVIVDDGSTDDSYNIVLRYAERDDRIKPTHQSNAGAPVARNRAYAMSTGMYIQYLDADDFFPPTFIEEKVRMFQNVGNCKIVTSDIYRFGDNAKTSKSIINRYLKRNFDNPGDFFYMMAKHWAAYQISGWMVSREIHETVGPWDESLRRNQDGEMFVRLLSHSDGVCFCPTVVSYYRATPNSITSKPVTEEIWNSILRSYDSYAEAMLSYNNGNQMKKAIALEYSSLFYLYREYAQETVMQRLGQYGYNKPLMGKWSLARICSIVIGFNNTLKIISFFRENYYKLSSNFSSVEI